MQTQELFFSSFANYAGILSFPFSRWVLSAIAYRLSFPVQEMVESIFKIETVFQNSSAGPWISFRLPMTDIPRKKKQGPIKTYQPFSTALKAVCFFLQELPCIFTLDMALLFALTLKTEPLRLGTSIKHLDGSKLCKMQSNLDGNLNQCFSCRSYLSVRSLWTCFKTFPEERHWTFKHQGLTSLTYFTPYHQPHSIWRLQLWAEGHWCDFVWLLLLFFCFFFW